MKTLITFCLALFCFKNFAQGDFKKQVENGNQKFNIKSYKLAIADYDNAIKLVSHEIDRHIAEKQSISADKKYLLEPYTKRAICFYFIGNTSLMKSDLEKVAQLDPANIEVKTLKSFETFKNGDKVTGCSGLRAEINGGSKLAKQVFEECFCWSEGVNLAKESASKNALKKYDEAFELIEKAIKILPDSGSFYAEKGKALMGKNEHEKALKELKHAAKLNKSNYKVYYYLGMAYNNLSKSDSAFESLTTAVNLSKNNFDVIYLRAEVAEKMEQWNAAVFDLQQCIKIRPTDGKLYFKVAEIKQYKQEDLLGSCEFYNSAFGRGVEEAKEMADNCNNPKYMKKNLKKAEK